MEDIYTVAVPLKNWEKLKNWVSTDELCNYYLTKKFSKVIFDGYGLSIMLSLWVHNAMHINDTIQI